MMMKADVLSGFKEIKVCVGYEKNGKRINHFPTSQAAIESITPIYESLKGWNKDISEIRDYENLPKEAKDYLTFISMECGFEIQYVSVGPKRSQTIEL